jgi:hypothetical protein
MFLRQWARKDLQSGDMSALLELTDWDRWDNPNAARVARLLRRGFVTASARARNRDWHRSGRGALPTGPRPRGRVRSVLR